MKIKPKKLNHRELVKHARKWLAGECAVVVTEMSSGAGEEPDGIGFTADGRSILIECKATRADMKADEKKVYRVEKGLGMGVHRYYLTPEGLLTEDDLPLGWGLLEVSYGRVRRIKCSVLWEPNERREIRLLVSAFRRFPNPPQGVSVRAYSIETLKRATLGIETQEKEEDV